MHDPEQIWASILSRDAATIRAAWETLSAEERAAVLAHLDRMVTEEGWAEPQRISAQAALDILPAQNAAGDAAE